MAKCQTSGSNPQTCLPGEKGQGKTSAVTGYWPRGGGPESAKHTARKSAGIPITAPTSLDPSGTGDSLNDHRVLTSLSSPLQS